MMGRLSTVTMTYMIIAVIDSALDNPHSQTGSLGYSYDNPQSENASFSYHSLTAEQQPYAYGDDEQEDCFDVEDLKERGYPPELLEIEEFLREAAGKYPVIAPQKAAEQNEEISKILDPETNPNIFKEIEVFLESKVANLLSESTIPHSLEKTNIPEGAPHYKSSGTILQENVYEKHLPQTSRPNDPTQGAYLVPITTSEPQQPEHANKQTPTKRRAEDHGELEIAKSRRGEWEGDVMTGAHHRNIFMDFKILDENDIFFGKPGDFLGKEKEYKKWKNPLTARGRHCLEKDFLKKFSFDAYFRKLKEIMPNPEEWKKQLRLLLCLILRSLDLYKFEPPKELPYITPNILCVQFELNYVVSERHYVHHTEIEGYDGLFFYRWDIMGLLNKPLAFDEGYGEALYGYIKGALVNLDYKKMIILSNKTTLKYGLQSCKPVQVFFREDGDILLYARPLKYFKGVTNDLKYYARLLRFLKVKICVHVLSAIGDDFEKDGLENLIETIRAPLPNQPLELTDTAGPSTGMQTTTPYGHPISKDVTFLLVPSSSDIKHFPKASQYVLLENTIQQLYGEELRENRWLVAMSKDVFEKTYGIKITLETGKWVCGKDSLEKG